MIGVALTGIAGLVLTGWALKIPLLVRVREDFTGMVANTAFCFLLLGLSLCWSRTGRASVLRNMAGAIVVVLSSGVLVESIFSISLGLDWPQWHAWLKDQNPHPGRMAPNTALAFLCAGIVTLLSPRVDSKANAVVIQVLTFLVMLLGLTGFVGYTLQLNLLYSWASLTQMALHTAVGIILLGFGLWCRWRTEHWYTSRQFFRDDEKIGIVSVVSLVVIAMAAGIAGFAGQKSGLEKALAERLPSELRHQTIIFNAALDRSFADANSIARRPNLLRLTAELAKQPDNPALRQALDSIAQSALASGSTAVSVIGVHNEVLSKQGHFVDPNKIAFAFNAPFDASLVWDGQFFAKIALPLQGPAGRIGTLHVEQPLPLINAFMMEKGGLGRTGESGMCFTHPRFQDQLSCFPQHRNPKVYIASKINAHGAPTPMALAVEGKSGMFQGLDYRGRNVIAVHGPVSANGLGMVIKQDTEELLTPIREQVLWTGPLLLTLVISGVLLLRSQIAPLTSRLMVSERAASEREERIQTLLQSVDEGIITMTSDGTVETFNTAASRIFAYEPAEVVGQRIEMLMPVPFRSAHAAGMRRYLAGGDPAVIGKGRVQLQGLRKGGEIFPLELTLSAIKTGGERLFIGIVRDIAEQIRARHDLEMAMEAAQKAASARSVFVANMSHELRTPMNAVLGISELLARSELSPEQRRDVGMIRSAGQSLLAIINNILDFSKIDAGKVELSPAPFHLDQVLRNLASIMSLNAAEKNIELAIGVDLDVPKALIGDAHRLEQVLVNLIANAIKFTDQGEVSVRVSVKERADPQVTLQFRVSDTGIGISVEQQARLFSPFSQADSSTTRRYGGTGLGLTISKGLVELLGGQITMESQVGRGSAFHFDIPLQVRGHNDTCAAKLAGLKILLVDDNATSLKCVSDTIRSWQWEVDEVSSGVEALRKIGECHAAGAPYDVILADWQMPGMDGIATMKAMRNMFKRAVMPIVIMVTAYGRQRVVTEIEHDAPEALLIKPVTASSLFDTVQEVLAVRGVITLPAAAEEEISIRVDARILLVEDNLINQFIAKSFLEHAGATVEIACNGQEAVDRLRDGAHFDVILMDVQMPVMDGFAATRLIRNELKLTTPVIAMTAGVMEEERESCSAAGMDAFVGKPIDVAHMLTIVNTLTIGRSSS